MKSRRESVCLPEILAVTRDEGEEQSRAGGSPAGSDIVSVYLEGGPRYRLGDVTYEFNPPIALLLPAGCYDGDQQEGTVHGIFTLFNGHRLLMNVPAPESCVMVSMGKESVTVPYLKELFPADARELERILGAIAEITDVGLTGRMHAGSLLLRAIAKYCEADTRAGAQGVHREAMRLRRLIEEWAFENVALSKVYAELNLSAAHAGVLFKDAYGTSPVAYRTQLRLWRARELLISSRLNVGQVAYEVGYTDPMYFSRVFHKAFGTTPSSLVYNFGNTRK